MSRNGTPTPGTVDALVEQVVAEALTAGLSAAEDIGWRRGGSMRASDRNLTNLTIARNDTRRLVEGSEWDDGNEFAIGAAENRVNYVIGDGFTYEVTGGPDSLRAEVQEFVDAFYELNNLQELEIETLWRCDRDGEVFLRLFPAGGIPEARFVEPERVRPPASVPPDDRWGVAFDPGGGGRVVGYYIEPSIGGEPELIPEAAVLHGRFNTTSASPRGWPTFEPVARALRRAEELLVAGTASGKAQAKLALIRKVPNLTRERAEQAYNRLTQRYQDQPGGDPPKLTSVEELPYGAVLRVRADEDVVIPTGAAGAASGVIELVQANLRAAGARLNMPEVDVHRPGVGEVRQRLRRRRADPAELQAAPAAARRRPGRGPTDGPGVTPVAGRADGGPRRPTPG